MDYYTFRIFQGERLVGEKFHWADDDSDALYEASQEAGREGTEISVYGTTGNFVGYSLETA